MIAWVYGRPCSGKSYLLNSLPGVKIDSHEIRELSNIWDLTPEGRERNIRNLAAIARTLDSQGIDICVAAITPLRSHRDIVKSIIPDVTFILANWDQDHIEERQAERFGDNYKDECFEYEYTSLTHPA